MSNILTIAYSVEGKTDQRFLENIIQRTFEEIAYECEGDIDVYPLLHIASPGLDGFVENAIEIATTAFNNGIQVLCIHTDADSGNSKGVIEHKIRPAVTAINYIEINACKNIVPVIPVRMSEAWMLADKELFKEEIGTGKTNIDLGIARQPELMANPKQVIENALLIAQEGHPKKLKKIMISALYQPIGQNISLTALSNLSSYVEFRNAVVLAFRKLNYLK